MKNRTKISIAIASVVASIDELMYEVAKSGQAGSLEGELDRLFQQWSKLEDRFNSGYYDEELEEETYY